MCSTSPYPQDTRRGKTGKAKNIAQYVLDITIHTTQDEGYVFCFACFSSSCVLCMVMFNTYCAMFFALLVFLTQDEEKQAKQKT
jgi:hypothetical protein